MSVLDDLISDTMAQMITVPIQYSDANPCWSFIKARNIDIANNANARGVAKLILVMGQGPACRVGCLRERTIERRDGLERRR